MKKLSLTSLLLVITLGLTSCSNETDPLLLDDPNAEAFEQKLTVQKSADGYYSLGYKLSDGFGSDITTNSATNTKNINLYQSDREVSRAVSEELSLNGKESFSVGINNTMDDSKSTLTIFDDDVKFSRSQTQDNLKDYKVTNNSDNTLDLDFTVEEGVVVDYIYDGDRNVYEIHLNKGSSTDTSYHSKTFTKEEGKPLKIEFIHKSDVSSSRSVSSSTKPVIIWDEAADGV